jgi:WD40 repeat protein
MAVCPFCRNELREVELRGEKCPRCGNALGTGQTLVFKLDEVPGLLAHLQGEDAPRSQPTVVDEEAAKERALVGDRQPEHSPPPIMPTIDSIDELPGIHPAGDSADPPSPPRPVQAAPRSFDASMMMTMQFGAENMGDPTLDSVGSVPKAEGSFHETTYLPDAPDAGGGDNAADAGNVAVADPDRPVKPATDDGGSLRTVQPRSQSTRDSQLVIKSRVVSDAGPAESDAPNMPDYQLLSVLGKGGMGVVYSAKQTSIDRTVAVKMLNRETATKASNRDKFLSEAVVTGDLDHPNIVAIYELGANDLGALFYSMKCVQGTPWNQVLAQKSLTENLEILMKVADAVGFAHSRGVVHRDIKPENVMLGEFGEVLLMDWGMALATPQFRKAGSIAPTTSMGGTPAYMAPEMTTGPIEAIGPASDIYLLGATLFEIVTGGPPHTGGTITECLRSAMNNNIQPTQKTGELLAIAMRAMATLPADRFETVRALQDEIRVALSHSESIVLTAKAREHLVEAQENRDYQAYARALFGFQEAIALWDGNEPAKVELVHAKQVYAEHALSKEDFDLAASLLDADRPEHAPLLARVAEARLQRAARDRRLKNVKRLAIGLAASIFAVGSLAYYQIRTERDRAKVAEQSAKADRDKAVVAEGKATTSQKLAQTAAEKARAAAEEAELAAIKEKASAEQAREAEQRARADRDKARLAKEAEEYESYVARIGLAAAKIDENAFEQAAELLAECQPQFRHWEWGRLEHLCRQSVYSFVGEKPVNSIAVSKDGKLLATGSWDGAARLWSLDDRKLIREIPYGGTYVNSVAISPDGTLLATGGSDRDGFVKLWDVGTGALRKALKGHSDAVTSVTFSSDGKRLLSGSYDKTARLWNVDTGEATQTFQGHTWWVWSAGFSPDERSIVTAGQDRTVRVWPIATGRAGPPFTGHDGPVYAAAFSPDGKHVATGGYDNQILLYKPDDLRPFDYEKLSSGETNPPPSFRAFKGHTGPVRAVRFSPDGTRLLSGSDDHTIRVWDVESGDLLKTLRGHAGWVRSCEFTPDGHWIVSGSHDNTARLWSIAAYEEVRIAQARLFQGHADAILSASFSPDGQQIVTASRDRTARLWDLSLAKELRKFEEGHQYLATTAVFFPDGKKLVTSASDNTTVVWDTASGTETLRLEPTGRSAAIALSSDGRNLLTGGEGQTAQVWDAATGKLLRTLRGHTGEVTSVACSPTAELLATGDANGLCIVSDKSSDQPAKLLRGHSGRIAALAFLPDGSRLLSASDDKTVAQWDVASGREIKDLVMRHPDAVTALAISTDGRTAFTCCEDGNIRLWETATGRAAGTLDKLDGPASSAALSRDGRYAMAVSTRDRTVRVWDLQTKKPIAGPHGAFLAGEAGAVWSAAFSPVGPQIVTVAGSGARLWDIPSRSELMSFSPNGAVVAAQFSPDGQRLVTGGWDGAARVWNVETGKAELKLRSDRHVNAVAFTPDGELLVMGTDAPVVQLCDAESGELVRTFAGHTGRITCVAVSAQGDRVLTGSDDRSARLWDAATGTQLLEFNGHRQAITCVAFDRSGTKVMTGSDDKTAILWDASTGEQLLSLEGHTAGVTSVAIAPDGRRALTASHDASAKLWDIAGRGKELLSLKAHRQPLTSVSFSPDGLNVLTASRDGTAILWLASDWHTAAPPERQAAAD